MDVALPKPGTYVIGVSGGVDSTVLLHILHNHSKNKVGWKLVVAHLDHGIRHDSLDDRQFVQSISWDYGLPFVYDSARLGNNTSEATARATRYKFLQTVKKASNAQSIITAHHQDDLLETAIINLIRGSGRKGITALSSRPELLRPLLRVPKADILRYAKENKLSWREDSTNQDESYLRNYVRRRVLPRFDDQSREKFLAIIENMQDQNKELDTLLAKQLHLQDKPSTLSRTWFNSLPHAMAKEIFAEWLRTNELRNFDAKTIERLVVKAKTAKSGRHFAIRGRYKMSVRKDILALEIAER